MQNAIEVNLKVVFPDGNRMIRAVEGVDLTVKKGECLALVGESGCGKSMASLSCMKLQPSSAAVRLDKLCICGEDVTEYTERQMQALRGSKISMIFQDALTALNPVMTIGKQMDEIYRCHEKISKKQAKLRSIEALEAVGIPDAKLRYHAFPHELSGGMRQRVLIAMAFACEPEVIIADEPTTALDVTIQAQILELLSKMQKEKQTALLLITHDLSVVRSMADRIAVMYSGKIVEEAPAKELLENPLHPYTKGLMAAVARLDDDKKEFVQIPGHLPDPADKPAGCYFHPRCPYAAAECKKAMPLLTQNEQGRKVRCYEAGKFKE
jgi:peptide/nickel transport system ATP-binding protein